MTVPFPRLALSVGLIALASCRPADVSDGPPVPLGVRDTNSVVIRLARGMCYGTCPVYSLIVRGSGDVTFIGRGHVATMDSASGQISRAQVAALLRAFERARYVEIPDQYSQEDCSDRTDHPNVSTSIEFDGRTKDAPHYLGCDRAPASLHALETAIDSIVGTQQWIGDPDPLLRSMTGAELNETYGRIVVRIEQAWRLIDGRSGKPVYHKVVRNEFRAAGGKLTALLPNAGAEIPAYVRDEQGSVAPLLTLDPAQGRPIASISRGAGVVVTEDGFILSDLALVAGWMMASPLWDGGSATGVLTNLAGKPQLDSASAPVAVSAPVTWLPAAGAQGLKVGLRGQHDSLVVTLGSWRSPARLVRADPVRGLAILKVDVPQSLLKAQLRDSSVATSTNVVLLAPSAAADTGADPAWPTRWFRALLTPPATSSGDSRPLQYDVTARGPGLDTALGIMGAPILDHYGRVVALLVHRPSSGRAPTGLKAVAVLASVMFAVH